MLSERREEQLLDHLSKETFNTYCDRCNTKAVVTVRIEQETGDFGSVLSSWPEFDLDEDCPGPRELNEFLEEEERIPENCPFHRYQEWQYNPPCMDVLGQYHERKRVRQIVGVEKRKLHESV